MTSGDGWVHCAAGHRHWGRFGAAGLLLYDTDRVILQHRAPWTHEGDSWGVPGGARHSDEDPVTAAIREAGEEAGLDRADVDPIGLYVDDHGGWSYATVVARATRPVQPAATDRESVTVRWHPVDAVAELPLHSGFAAAWRFLREPPSVLYLLVTAELATDRRLTGLLQDGIPSGQLPGEIAPAGLHRLYPHLLTAATADELVATAAEYAGLGQLLLVRDDSELSSLAG